MAKRHAVSPLLYGLFFEEINFGGEGGLYAELIRNRDFEAMGRGNLGDGGVWNTRPWTISGGTGVIDASTHPFATNPNTLKVTGSKVVITNPGYWGINCRVGMTYKGSLWAKTSGQATLRATLKNGQADASPEAVLHVSGDWKKYTFSLTANARAPEGQFQLVVENDASGTVWLDHVSLFPGDAVRGLFRKDLFDKLQELKPSFIRFPGGNYLEGNVPANKWDWKKTIGAAESRSGHMNDAWGYWTNDGLGMFEYLILCEALGAAPQMSVFTGYSMGTKYGAYDPAVVQDALDAIDFANGAASTPFGKIRSDMGHAASFNMQRLEVGNEETQMAEYATRYRAITQAVWKKSPSVVVVASGPWGPSLEGSPCLTGQRCDVWDAHAYMSPESAAGWDATRFDEGRYDRKQPKVFMGEYAAQNWASADKPKQETVRPAIAEAAFLVGLERNSDVVVQSSFAPLFGNKRGMQWSYDLINFDSSRVYVLPSFHVQKVFRQEQCDHTIQWKTAGITAGVACVKSDGAVVVKLVNFGDSAVSVDVSLDALASVPQEATLITFGGDGNVANTLEKPDNVTPRTETIRISRAFTVAMKPMSFSLIRIGGKAETAESSKKPQPSVLISSSNQNQDQDLFSGSPTVAASGLMAAVLAACVMVMC
eukprot:m51a1_g2946 putative alpha-l-arabinofuranosidase (653) ;mRNA; r:619613-621785